MHVWYGVCVCILLYIELVYMLCFNIYLHTNTLERICVGNVKVVPRSQSLFLRSNAGVFERQRRDAQTEEVASVDREESLKNKAKLYQQLGMYACVMSLRAVIHRTYMSFRNFVHIHTHIHIYIHIYTRTYT